jgi:uncharacterized membrane protein
LPRFKVKRRPLVTIVYFVVASVALLAVIAANTVSLSHPEKSLSAFYQPDEVQGFAWLRANAVTDDLVVTTFDQSGKGSGGRMVAATGLRVFIGHWIETAHFEDKMKQIKQFYDTTTSDDWRREFLKEINAIYIWYDDSARLLGSWNPADADYLKSVYTSKTIDVYQVN